MIYIGLSSNKICVPEVSVKRNELALFRITRRKLQKNCLFNMEVTRNYNFMFASLNFRALSF
jgi:hypothetical protein